MAEQLPFYAMPERKPAGSHRGLVAGIVFLLALGAVFVLDRESVLHGMIFGTVPFSLDNVLASVSEYGHWLFSLYLLVTAAALFLESRNPDRTLAWLLALALVPVFGVVLYWIVGPNFRYLADKRRFRLPKLLGPPADCGASEDTPLVRDTVQLLARTSGARLTGGLNATPLYDGATAFARIRERLAGATRGILLETYIFRDDKTGAAIRDILVERAKSGVFVCVIFDAVGSWHTDKAFWRSLREGGVHLYAFLPVAFPMFRGANYRNHRKILIVDGETAFMGGMNIADEYAGTNPRFTRWRDTHLEFNGEAVDVPRTVFLGDLAACGAPASLLERAREATALPLSATAAGQTPPLCPGMTPMQIIASGPDTPWDTVHKGYFSLIARAREKLWLTSPYLVPGASLLEALCTASLSGVDVRLIVPGKADKFIVQWANASCFDELLRAGVRIFLYDPGGFIHAKTVICDGTVLSLGSANLDTRSLHINFEIQSFLYDRNLAREAAAVFEEDMRRSLEVTFAAWRKRPRSAKVRESAGKLFSSLL